MNINGELIPNIVNKDVLFNSVGSKNLITRWMQGTVNDTTGVYSSTGAGWCTDYIPVDFNKNSNYRVSGLPASSSNYRNFVAAYNSGGTFLGRTGGSATNDRTLTSSSFTSGTPAGTGTIAYIRVSMYNNTPFSYTESVWVVEGSKSGGFSPAQQIGYMSYHTKTGDVIRFADGTQIAWGIADKSLFVSPGEYKTVIDGVSWYRSDNAQVIRFEVPFKDSNVSLNVTPNNGITGSRIAIPRINSIESAGFTLQFISPEKWDENGTAYINFSNVHWFAIGRWK